MRSATVSFLASLALAACEAGTPNTVAAPAPSAPQAPPPVASAAPPAPSAPAASADAGAEPPRHGEGEMVAFLRREAAAMRSELRAPFAQRFLDATAALPAVRTRRVFHDRDKSHWYTEAQAAALSADERAALGTLEVDEERWYDADVSSPLDYARPLDIVSAAGLELGPGARVLDFGYGSIGHLRMLASLGLDLTGVEVQVRLLSLYAEPGDTGSIPGFQGAPAGRIRLLNGFFPSELVPEVGAGYRLAIAKNVLKKGYIHPDRPVPERRLIHLRVDDATFLRSFHKLLAPGGMFLVFNICAALTPPDQPLAPMTDCRSPFTREQWKAAGFEVRAFDEKDTDAMRRIYSAIESDDGQIDLDTFYVLYTLVQRKK